MLASSSYVGGTCLWDASTGEQLHALGDSGFMSVLRFDSSGRRIAFGDREGVRVHDVTTGELVVRFQGHRKWVRDLRFLDQDSRVASVSDEGTILVWDASTGSLLASFRDAGAGPLALSPDGRTLYSLSRGTGVTAWRSSEPPGRATLAIDGGKTVAFHPGDGRPWVGLEGWVGAGARRSNGHGRAAARGPRGRDHRARVPRDGSQLACGSSDGELGIVAVDSGEVVRPFRGHGAPIVHVRYSSDRTGLLSLSEEDGFARTWDVSTSERLSSLRIPRPPQLWLATTAGEESSHPDLPLGDSVVAISANGEWGVVETWRDAQKCYCVRSLSTGAERGTLEGLDVDPVAGTFSWTSSASLPPSRTSAWAYGMSRAARRLLVLPLTDEVIDLAMSHDGQRIAALTGSGVVLWDSSRRPRTSSGSADPSAASSPASRATSLPGSSRNTSSARRRARPRSRSWRGSTRLSPARTASERWRGGSSRSVASGPPRASTWKRDASTGSWT